MADYRDMLAEGKAISVDDHSCKNCYLWEHGDKQAPWGYNCKGGFDGPYNPATGGIRKPHDTACMYIHQFFMPPQKGE